MTILYYSIVCHRNTYLLKANETKEAIAVLHQNKNIY